MSYEYSNIAFGEISGLKDTSWMQDKVLWKNRRYFVIDLLELLKNPPPHPYVIWNSDALDDYSYTEALKNGFDTERKIHITYIVQLRKIIVWQEIVDFEINWN